MNASIENDCNVCIVQSGANPTINIQQNGDDNFIVDNRHVINICNEIVKRKLDIQFDIAGGYVNSYNDDVIDHLVAAGMVSTILNIEHGSEYIRNEIIKKSKNLNLTIHFLSPVTNIILLLNFIILDA